MKKFADLKYEELQELAERFIVEQENNDNENFKLKNYADAKTTLIDLALSVLATEYGATSFVDDDFFCNSKE